MFFDSEIVIRGNRSGRAIAATLPACLVDDGTGDPLSQSATASDCDNVCAYVKRESWPEVEPPKLGDSVELDGGERYAVKRVTRLADCFCLSLRRV